MVVQRQNLSSARECGYELCLPRYFRRLLREVTVISALWCGTPQGTAVDKVSAVTASQLSFLNEENILLQSAVLWG